jgi:hypothetical protein
MGTGEGSFCQAKHETIEKSICDEYSYGQHASSTVDLYLDICDLFGNKNKVYTEI